MIPGTADPDGMGMKVVPLTLFHYAVEYCVLARLSLHTDWDQLWVFGAISSSSILRPILYTNYYSMV